MKRKLKPWAQHTFEAIFMISVAFMGSLADFHGVAGFTIIVGLMITLSASGYVLMKWGRTL